MAPKLFENRFFASFMCNALLHSLPGLAAGFSFLLTSVAPAAVTYEWVNVGNPGNADDASGYGSVGYSYNIGKFEVTNAQYTEFLNTVDPTGVSPNGIYNTSMGSEVRGGIAYAPLAANGAKYSVKADMGNKPVNFVSWFNAARFANWMNNGQGAGDTETGAYSLTGNTGVPTRNSNATIWLPSEDEWYKAAYYDSTKGGVGGYWLYPTRSDSVPTVSMANATGDISNPGGNVANFNFGADWSSQNGNVTTVGSAGAGSASFYGTYDQGGNVWEWNERLGSPPIFANRRGLRGGSWVGAEFEMESGWDFSFFEQTDAFNDLGFRLASVPEPSGVLMVSLSGLAFLMRRRPALI